MAMSSSQRCAQDIMGKNFLGIEKVIQHFSIVPTQEEIAKLADVPFSKTILRERKDTHILVAVFPLSILDIRKKVERNLFDSHNYAWYNNQAFAKEKGETSWHLIRKDVVPESTNKTWQEQQALLDEKEGVPSARVMTYTIIGYYMSSGERLFEKTYARCQCLCSLDGQVGVGRFGSRGLYVSNYWYDSRHANLGLASFLRIQSLNS